LTAIKVLEARLGAKGVQARLVEPILFTKEDEYVPVCGRIEICRYLSFHVPLSKEGRCHLFRFPEAQVQEVHHELSSGGCKVSHDSTFGKLA